MKKQFFRVKQLADQTFLRAEKSDVLNHEELHVADQRVEYLRTALSAIIKKIPQTGQNNNDIDKRAKKCFESHLASVFHEQCGRRIDTGGFQDEEERLFQSVLRDCADLEQSLAKDYADHELKIEEYVSVPIQTLLDNDFPNILKQKRILSKYILDKDSASNRYHSTRKEALKDDMEEADSKVEQTRDALAFEMFNLLSKENEMTRYIFQLLKLQRAYHESALKQLEEVIPRLEKRIGESPVRPVYGTPLKEHLQVSGKRIAYPLEMCISVLTKFGLSEEGLFRIAGGSSRVKRLKYSFDSGCLTYLIPEYQDVHVLASALKMYLRELPDPLLTSHLYNDWMHSMQKPEGDRLEIVKKLISRLPQENRENLSFLMQFLAKLSRHPENKMTSSNIAIVIAPNLLWGPDKNNINMGNCATINMLTELFIKEVDTLFPEDLTKLVSFSFSQDEEVSVKSANLNNVEFNVSTENVSVTDSPKPNSRRKKPAAPVPPSNIVSKTDQDVSFEKSSLFASYPSGSSTLNRSQKPKDNQKNPKTSVAVNTDEQRPSLVQEEAHTNISGPKVTSLVNLDSSKTVEHKYVTQPAAPVQVSKAKPVQPVIAQNANCDNKNFKTTITHNVTQQKPVAAPRSIDVEKNPASVARSSSIRIDLMSKSMSELTGDVHLRRPEVASKPEVPARPASLQKRSSIDTNLDPAVHKTQCSVYSVAHKQQPSYVNLQNRNEKFQPGHDNQIAEKEKFLGHLPGLKSSPENRVTDTNSNSSKPGLPPKLTKSDEKLDATKSNEELSDIGEKLFVNGNQKVTSHVRTRSDGNLIDLSDSSLMQTPPSPRSLNKPSQPPPPPPTIAVVKKEPDSTDL